METFQIAHLNLPGPQGPVNVIIVFVTPAFAQLSPQRQNEAVFAIERCARQEELAGNVVPVWMDSSGRLRFVAPQNQHAFFTSVSYPELESKITHTLNCQ